MTKTWILEARFSAAHFYAQEKWTPEQNEQTFGRCCTPYGHGHNYRVQAEWKIERDHDLETLRASFLKIVDQFDHRHLNFDFKEFQDQVPTTEVIAQVLAQKLQRGTFVPLSRLVLYEDQDIGAIWETAFDLPFNRGS
ncbi:MAG: 6-pyruvoyl trahydropterin synthase family protein [Bdellovibrionales bacterium]